MVEARRWPWLAALLSFVFFAGLGQAYAGRWRRAFLICAGDFVCSAVALALMLYVGVALAFGLLLAYRIYAAVDAARVTKERHAMAVYVRWPVYLALVVGIYLAFYGLALLERDHVAEAFWMPMRSMETTIVAGDFFLTEKLAFEPKRHDVVVYKTTVDGESQNWVKRVVGMPGEHVELRDGRLYVDGKPVEEGYVQGEPEDFGPVVVPADSYFVLGDHRDLSRDSRHDGAVARERIFARAKVVFWSEDDDGVRWSRVGKRIR